MTSGEARVATEFVPGTGGARVATADLLGLDSSWGLRMTSGEAIIRSVNYTICAL
jgi:hypothetical protein